MLLGSETRQEAKYKYFPHFQASKFHFLDVLTPENEDNTLPFNWFWLLIDAILYLRRQSPIHYTEPTVNNKIFK
jgi:hypothetical protein